MGEDGAPRDKPGDDAEILEHFSARWIRFAVKTCGTAKKGADSTPVETALTPLLPHIAAQDADDFEMG